MSDDFEDTPRRKKKKASGDNTLKIVLIVFGGFFGLTLLVCCGTGAYFFYLGKKFASQVAMKNPADIQNLVTEMTDITIPPEFAPQHGSSIFGIKMAQYKWCPAKNCPPSGLEGLDDENSLMLTSIKIGDEVPAGDDDEDTMMTDEMLKHSWKEYTKTEHTFDIRGKSSKFYIVQGEEFAMPQADFDNEGDMPAQAEPATDPAAGVESAPETESAGDAPATTPPSSRPGTGKKVVHVSGTFPGKQAPCTLQIRLNADSYDEGVILEMLKSIK